MVVKNVSVKVYIGDVEVGSGRVKYTDESKLALLPASVRRCDRTPIYAGDVEVGYVELCRDDIETWWIPGVRTYEVVAPVYVGDVEAGVGRFNVEDGYGMSLVVLFLVLLLILR